MTSPPLPFAALSAVSGEGHWQARLSDGKPLHLVLSVVSGGGRMLRARAGAGSASADPQLPPGATSEVVKLLWDAPQPMTAQTTDFRIVAANRAYCEAFGRQPSQLLGHDPIEFAPEAEHAADAARAGRCSLLGQPSGAGSLGDPGTFHAGCLHALAGRSLPS